jgi:leader peptidase (prepilin peptidase)/N-methyltransferase
MTTPGLLAIGLGVMGLVAGSFLGLVSLRLPAGRDIVAGRSRCAACHRTLPPLQLIPVASYLLSGGRCGRCRRPIPIRYPLIESGCLLIGVCAALAAPTPLAAGLFALTGWQGLLAAILYAEHRKVSLPLMAGLLATAAAALVAIQPAMVGLAF